MNDGAFLASVEASSPAEFGRLLTRPSVEEERVLRRYFGDERYRRWHNLALLRRRGRRLSQDHAPVVIIPDLFLCELFTVEDSTRRERLWLSPQRLIAGDLERLRLARGQDFSDDDDEVEVRVEPGSAMKRVYGELILTLAEQRPVYLFGYDWRRSARQTARSLAARIADWIGDDDSFHLVAHGFGGIIARTFIADHSERWTHRPRKANGKEVGRLIMLGTPNQGAYSSVRTLAGLDTWVRRLAILDNSQERRELLQTLNTFPSLYETLPSPVQSDTKKVYDPDEYGSLPVSRANFESAKEHYRRLNTSTGKAQNRLTADVERMVCLAGYGYCTASGLVRGKDLDTDDAYRWDDGGDGVVPHTLVRIQSPGMAPVPMVYVREEHIGLPANRAVLSVLDDLLTENLKNLQAILPVGLTTEVPEPKVCPGVREADPKSDDVSIQLARAAEDLRSRSASVRSTDGSTPAAALSTTPDEEGAITDSFLQPASDGAGAARARPRPSSPSSKIEMRVVLGDISRTDPEEDSANLDEERDIRIATDDVPIDVIAVGHYSGLRPQAAVQDLDIAIRRSDGG